tara:strand:+ start:128 stop:394 length:267 start_codon:yes stop_codon:yes gene_type:complete
MSNVEASAGGPVDYQGWPKKPPISDRECIYKCLENCESLAGLDKDQVQRLMKEIMAPPKIFPNRLCKDFRDFKMEKTDEQIKSEYPPL